MAPNLDWKNLGFEYMKTDCFVKSEFKNGSWGPVTTCPEPTISLHIGATALHYGQACFEGLKAFTQKDGRVAIFRPGENARRMASTARRIVMQAPPEELFLEACVKAVNLNRSYVPPFGTGASMYIRPLLIGTTARVGVQPADDYLFAVMVMPVGPYYKHGFHPVKCLIQENYDRAAPRGVGNVKVAGNYAAGLLGQLETKKKGYPIDLYLDSAEHTYIDEFGTSNFLGITSDNRYVTPDSSSVLPSITNLSLQQIARDMGLTVEKRRIHVSDLPNFKEVGACGTAAVITPIHSICFRDKTYTYGEEDKVGKTMTRLFQTLQGIQYGEVEDRHGWMVGV